MICSLGLLFATATIAVADRPTPLVTPGPIRGIAGYPSERYVLYAGGQRPSDRFGAVVIRPIGVSRAPASGTVRTVVDIAADIESLGDGPVTIDVQSLDLTVATLDDRTFAHVRAARVSGEPTASATGQATMHAFFMLPPDVAPADVAGLRLAWMVRANAGAHITTTAIEPRFTVGDNAASLYVVPRGHPLLQPPARQLVLPRPQAYRKVIMF